MSSLGSLARTHEGVRGLPRGRSRLPKQAVRAAQRDRLVRAMIAAAADDGYAQVTVADVVRRARVSRTAFYAHFDDKEDCFVAACVEGRRQLLTVSAEAVRAAAMPGDDELLLRLALRAYLQALREEPAFTRVLYLELPTLGRVADEREMPGLSQWAAVNKAWHLRARQRHPDWPQVPDDVYLALAGATGELVRDRVRSDTIDTLPDLEDTLVGLHLAVLAAARWPQ